MATLPEYPGSFKTTEPHFLSMFEFSLGHWKLVLLFRSIAEVRTLLLPVVMKGRCYGNGSFDLRLPFLGMKSR